MTKHRTFIRFHVLPFLMWAFATWGSESNSAQARSSLQGDLNLRIERGLSWSEVDQVGQRCFRAYAPTAGNWVIEVTTTAPPSYPALVAFDPNRGEAGGPSVVSRHAGIQVRVPQAGYYVVCLSSRALLGGDVTIRNLFLADSWLKGGDELEVELELEGVNSPVSDSVA